LIPDGDIVGTTYGSDTLTLSVDNLPTHAHGQYTDSDGGSNMPQVTNDAGGLDGLRVNTGRVTIGKTQVLVAVFPLTSCHHFV
jgi:microcystin-dependent protein